MLRERSYSNGRKGGVKYLGNIDANLDDFSRYIVAWKLYPTMKAQDVCDTLDLALTKTGLDQINVQHRPRLLSDNGASQISSDLAE
jgi:transposase InsO family protein